MKNNKDIEINFPEYIYHGTLDNNVPLFREKLLNRKHWRPDRDFGAGFYSTASLSQAQRWAIRMYEKEDLPMDVKPCVLQIRLLQEKVNVTCKTFWGPKLDWASFILQHRLNKDKSHDPCVNHPDLLAGPMADNKTGKVLEDMITLNKDIFWFLDQITRNEQEEKLDFLDLGFQIVFCNESLESILQLTGYHILDDEGWRYYGIHEVREA